MGFRPSEEELKSLLEEVTHGFPVIFLSGKHFVGLPFHSLQVDEDGSGEIEFGEFCQLCATFLVEDPDMETMKKELKDAFRLGWGREGRRK